MIEKIIQKIFQKEFNEKVQSIQEIIGLGSVNRIFDINGKNQNYIIRLNEEEDKKTEYQKEKWCLKKVASLGISSPKVLKMGFQNDILFMIQNKISGINGNNCTAEEKKNIWKTLGSYAAKFHQVQQIEDKEAANNFHKNWKAKLDYNIKELNKNDSILQKKILNPSEHKKAKEILSTLLDKDFKIGLVHGDLCPRNVILKNNIVNLLDWGTAEIDVVPHMEIGKIILDKEASEEEFQLFLEGLGISPLHYMTIEKEINILNLLSRLDLYRWAEGHQIDTIKQYEEKVKFTFDKINNTFTNT